MHGKDEVPCMVFTKGMGYVLQCNPYVFTTYIVQHVPYVKHISMQCVSVTYSARDDTVVNVGS